jgi:hypothetical protein
MAVLILKMSSVMPIVTVFLLLLFTDDLFVFESGLSYKGSPQLVDCPP